MAQGWKYWDNDFHEWRYFEPDESDDFVTTLYSGYKVKNDTSKLPSLKIYDLLEAGFEEVQYDDDDMDERCRTSKILKVSQSSSRVNNLPKHHHSVINTINGCRKRHYHDANATTNRHPPHKASGLVWLRIVASDALYQTVFPLVASADCSIHSNSSSNR